MALLAPAYASAHAFLVQSTPAAGERLAAAPAAVTLQFTEPVAQAGLEVTVRSAGGQQLPTGSPTLSAGGSVLSIGLPALTAGVYVVHWQVVSADDGHPSEGEFAFGVGTGAAIPATVATVSAPTDWPSSAARFVLLIGLAMGVGALVNGAWVWKGSGRIGPDADRQWMFMSFGIAAIGAVASVLIFAQRLAQPADAFMLATATWRNVVQARAGFLGLLALLMVLVAAGLYAQGLRTPSLLPLALATIAAALVTHPAAVTAGWGGLSIAVHVLLAVLWLGMLGHLVVQLAQRGDGLTGARGMSVVERYASLAIWSAAGVVLTGLLSALAVLHIDQLASSLYGRLLLVKALFVAVVLVVAGTMRLRGLHREARLPLIRRLTRVEATGLVAALAVATVLGGIAPPPPAMTASASGATLGPPPVLGQAVHVAGQAGWFEAYVTASNGQLMVEIVYPAGKPAADFQLIMTATMPDGTDIDLFPRPCGGGCYGMRFAWQPGRTVIHLSADSSFWAGGRAELPVQWPPLPGDPSLLASMIMTMQAEPQVQLDERVTSGPGATAHGAYNMTGAQFLVGEPYGQASVGTEGLPMQDGLRQLVLWLPGSKIWIELGIDNRNRPRTETIIDPGHLIQRSFRYPGG